MSVEKHNKNNPTDVSAISIGLNDFTQVTTLFRYLNDICRQMGYLQLIEDSVN